MKKVLCVAVGMMMDFPDDTTDVRAPLPKSPLDELAARLRREACHGRGHSNPDHTLPNVTAWMAAAFQECPDRN